MEEVSLENTEFIDIDTSRSIILIRFGIFYITIV